MTSSGARTAALASPPGTSVAHLPPTNVRVPLVPSDLCSYATWDHPDGPGLWHMGCVPVILF